MRDELTMSSINLHAVLRNLEDLCELDEQAKALIKYKNISIQFSVKNGPSALLAFRDGRCRMNKGGGSCNIKLYFSSPQHLNDMFEGKANPIPLKGLTRISFLKNEFTKLTERLTYYLKPTEELLKDPGYFNANTTLTAYTAFFALAEIGNLDPVGKLNGSRIPDGTIEVKVLNGGPSVYLTADGGKLHASKQFDEVPRAAMLFKDMEVANGVLSGKLDTYTCLATGDVQMKGFIPMIDYMNKVLALVPAFLS